MCLHRLLQEQLYLFTLRPQKNQVGLKLIGTNQLLIYADGNLFGDKINITKKSTETLLDSSKEIGLEVSADKIK
jgi:hypothetical protein